MEYEKYERCKYTFSELVNQYGNKWIPYSDLLRAKEWCEKHDEIVKRDDKTCQHCGVQFIGVHYLSKDEKQYLVGYPDKGKRMVPHPRPVHMEVHHEAYFENRLPWDYEDVYLTTLCDHCHRKFHAKRKVSVYTIDKKRMSLPQCQRCGGAGYMPKYKHVKNGICFACYGAGYEMWYKP